MISNSVRWWVLLLFIGATLLVANSVQPVANSATPAPATPAAPEVVREVLSHGDPGAAPEDKLELVRYTIPPNIELPVHTHPGMQVSTIESGVLLYTVVEGEAYVTRAGTAAPETITPASGETAIEPGDALVEPEGMVHFGRNGGTEPIVILTASLFDRDEPTAIEVTPAATPAA